MSKRGERERLRNKKERWENIWLDKSNRSIKRKLTRRRLMTSRPKYGRKTLALSLITKNRSKNILRAFIRSTSRCWRLRCKTSKTSRTARRWILCNCSTTRPWWKRQPKNLKKLKKQRYDQIILFTYKYLKYSVLSWLLHWNDWNPDDS